MTKTKNRKKTMPTPAAKAVKEARAEIRARIDAAADAPATGEPAVKGDAGAKAAAGTPPTPTSPATKAKGAKAKAPKPKKTRKPGCLDAAAQVLAGAKEPMGSKAIVEVMIDKKMWSTAGKTPGATLYAALIRDIAAKGRASRFRKTSRGLFTSAGA